MSPKILICLGTVRPGRMVERVAIAVKNIVLAEEMEPIILDPAQLPFEILKVPLHFMKDPANEAPAWMLEVNEKIKAADAIILVSGQYNCGIPPALSNMLDHFPPASYRHRPCAIVTYSTGNFGGNRVPLMLRPLISDLGMVSTPFAVAIPNVNQVFEEDGTCTSERISNNLTKLVKEVAWYANAIRSQKAIVPPPQ